jgi:hypothetical protein
VLNITTIIFSYFHNRISKGKWYPNTLYNHWKFLSYFLKILFTFILLISILICQTWNSEYIGKIRILDGNWKNINLSKRDTMFPIVRYLNNTCHGSAWLSCEITKRLVKPVSDVSVGEFPEMLRSWDRWSNVWFNAWMDIKFE